MKDGSSHLIVFLLVSVSAFEVRAAGNPAPVAGDTRDLALSLLKKYAETQAKLRSYVYTEEVSTEMQALFNAPPYARLSGNTRMMKRSEVRTDGNLASVRYRRWGNILSAREFVREDHNSYNGHLWDGKIFFDYYAAAADMPGRVTIEARRPEWFDMEIPSKLWNYVIASEIQEENANLSVRASREQVRQAKCFVLDARTPSQEFTVWIDPEHGHNVVKVTRIECNDSGSLSLENVECKKVDGIWIPVEGCIRTNGRFPNGDHFQALDHHQITKITLNPDRQALGSFVPDDIKNGARVSIPHYTDGRYSARNLPLWQDGKVVDSEGEVLDVQRILATAKLSLLNAPLPSLVELSKDLSQVQAGDKPLLVCLCDIEQRPSRQCLSELAKKAGALTAQGVSLLVVQTSKVDMKQHETWLKQNGVTIPLHVASADFETKRRAWGVKAVPWLILTDKSHVVRVEGFAVGDLDKVLQEVK